MDVKPKLIIGLGNPDKKYENTYHNVGHLFIEYLKTLNPSGYTLLASDVYMNESGKFVAKEIKKSGAKPEELLIVHDDSDIELGKYKLSFGRGAAGHHGVESVQAALKTNDFWRLRIGIRPKADFAGPKQTSQTPSVTKIQRGPQTVRNSPRLKASEFVLKKISARDKVMLEKTFSEIVDALKPQH